MESSLFLPETEHLLIEHMHDHISVCAVTIIPNIPHCGV
jgi:hypothetical protein